MYSYDANNKPHRSTQDSSEREEIISNLLIQINSDSRRPPSLMVVHSGLLEVMDDLHKNTQVCNGAHVIMSIKTERRPNSLDSSAQV